MLSFQDCLFFIRGNDLTRLPDLSGLKELKLLGLRSNKLQRLPTSVKGLSRLITLDLRLTTVLLIVHNTLSLASESDISFRNNRLGALPPAIGGLVSLRRLDLRQNNLEYYYLRNRFVLLSVVVDTIFVIQVSASCCGQAAKAACILSRRKCHHISRGTGGAQ
jgi:hypothetical protein